VQNPKKRARTKMESDALGTLQMRAGVGQLLAGVGVSAGIGIAYGAGWGVGAGVAYLFVEGAVFGKMMENDAQHGGVIGSLLYYPFTSTVRRNAQDVSALFSKLDRARAKQAVAARAYKDRALQIWSAEVNMLESLIAEDITARDLRLDAEKMATCAYRPAVLLSIRRRSRNEAVAALQSLYGGLASLSADVPQMPAAPLSATKTPTPIPAVSPIPTPSLAPIDPWATKISEDW
jgi:hypothetical protein